ncbi:hypothetical protein FQR65_LT13897 [Abscondita terminalis]|nr:hypothetical protein FQR65_LT13897 [Abscondita terminalis]
MNKWEGKIAVVTGASSGIGATICKQLVIYGIKVVGLARRNEKIEELSKKLQNQSGKLYAIKVDITKEEDILKAFKWISENLGPVHILINNAGIYTAQNLLTSDTKLWKNILDTNVLGLCAATREVIKIMKLNAIDGHIIHINSIQGHRVYPTLPFCMYTASKYAVTALTETLRLELQSINSKIKISSISPGAVKTESSQTENLNISMEYLAAMPFLETKDVADAVIYVLSTPPHVQIHELKLIPNGQLE